LISRRAFKTLPLAPGGTLADYVPFYFTPFSPMMMNIHSGRSVTQRANDEICILFSSIHKVVECGLPFMFSDRHAYLAGANFYNQLADLTTIDWKSIQTRNFKKDPNDPEKFEKYQAETLVHQHVPVEALLGIFCYSKPTKEQILASAEEASVTIGVRVNSEWYF